MSEPTHHLDVNAILDGLGLGREVTKNMQRRLAEYGPRYRRVRIGRLTITWRKKSA